MGNEHQPEDLDTILEQILRAEESGAGTTRDDWCARYPEHEESIRDFFANRDQLGLTQIFQNPVDEPTFADSSADQLPAPGEHVQYFGDYEIEHELARGGMGVVYRARQASLGRTVALKMILAGELASEVHVTRFRTEAEAAARLDHPNIVPIYEIGEHNGQHYFSMAYIDGESLADRIAGGPLPPAEAANIAAQAADAVQYAHDLDVIHRDLKPANVLLDGDRPKITDFGLAKRLDQQSLTATGEVLGTPGYMAPEQARSADAADRLSDVYGLGAILYASLTGRPPFQAANVVETLMQLTESEVVPPRQLNPSIPQDLETICLAALRKEPDKRYSSAAALAADLRRYMQGRPILARPTSAWEHVVKWARRRPLIASLSTALLLTLTAGAIVISSLWIGEREARLEATRAAEQATENEREAREAQALADAQAELARDRLVTSQLGIADLMYSNGQAAVSEQRYIDHCLEASARDDGDRRAWWRLWRTYVEYPRTSQLPVTGNNVTVSADGRFIAVVEGKTVAVVDASTLTLKHRYTSPVGTMFRAEFSPNSQWLVANHFAHSTLLVWDPSDESSEPVSLEPRSAELSGFTNLVAHAVTDEAGARLLKRVSNSRTGFSFRDADTVWACGADGMWAFDLTESDAEPVPVVERQRQGLPGISESRGLAQVDNEYWVTGFGSMIGIPLTVVEKDADGNFQYNYPGVLDKSLTIIEPPSSLATTIGMPETWYLLPEDQRRQVLVSSVFAVHTPTTRLAAVKDDILYVWDIPSRKELQRWDWPRSTARRPDQTWRDTKQLIFSSDGEQLVAVGDEIRVLTIAEGEIDHSFKWFGDATESSVCFTADGRHLLATDTTNPNSAAQIGVYPVYPHQVQRRKVDFSTTMSADGSLFSISNPEGPSLFNWTLPTIQIDRDGETTTASIPSSAGMSADRGISVAADGSRFVVAGAAAEKEKQGNRLIGFDTDSQSVLGTHSLEDNVVGLSVAPDGSKMSLLTADSIAVHALPGFEQQAEYQVADHTERSEERRSLVHRHTCWSHDATMLATIFNPVKVDFESMFVSGAEVAHLAVADLTDNSLSGSIECVGAECAVFLQGRDQIAVGRTGSNSTVDFLSLPDLQNTGQWQLGAAPVTAVAENAELKILACATRDGRMWFWDTQRNEPLIDFRITEGQIRSFTFLNGGRTMKLLSSSYVLTFDLQPAMQQVEQTLAQRGNHN